MHDSEFDKHIKAALEEFTDSTPVEEGWQKFQQLQQAAAPVKEGITRWLKASLVLNVLFAGLIGWLVWRVEGLDGRIGRLTNQQQNTGEVQKAEGVTESVEEGRSPLSADERLSGQPRDTEEVSFTNGDLESAAAPVAERQRAQRPVDASAVPEVGPKPGEAVGAGASDRPADEVSSAAEDETVASEEAFVPPVYNTEEDDSGPHGPAKIVAGEEASEQAGSPAPVRGANLLTKTPEPEKKKTRTPLKTIVALEKNSAGNKIGWEFGATGNFGLTHFGAGYAGTHVGAGLSVEAILHPLWGLETGVYFQYYQADSEDPAIMEMVWNQSAAPAAPLEDLESVVQSVEIPLLLKFRLPLSARTSGYASGGILYSYALSKKHTFELDYPDELDDTARDEDQWLARQAEPFFLAPAAEVGLVRQVSDKLRLRIGAYYRYCETRGDSFKGNIVGLKAGLVF